MPIQVLLLISIIMMGQRVRGIVEDTDQAASSMADFTIYIAPRTGGTTWGQFGKDVKSKQAFKSALGAYLDQVRTGVKVGTMPGRVGPESNLATSGNMQASGEQGQPSPAMWVVYDEDENIRVWRRKMLASRLTSASIASFL